MPTKTHIQAHNKAWEGCEKCDLAGFRDSQGQYQVFGEGNLNGILFLGESPSEWEAQNGRPFVGGGGDLLRSAVEDLGLSHAAYYAHTTLCRACGPVFNSEGQQIVGRRGPLIKSCAPIKPQVAACAPYLQELIYDVDPVLIFAMGVTVVKALKLYSTEGGNVSLGNDRGQACAFTLPGRARLPHITAKQQRWSKVVKGKRLWGSKTGEVEYTVILSHNPYDICEDAVVRGGRYDEFAHDLRLAANIYALWQKEVQNG